MASQLLIYNAHLVDKETDCNGAILLSDGKIAGIFTGDFSKASDAKKLVAKNNADIEFYDAHALTLMPAFVDMHVHLRYPGQTQKEDLQSGLKAAVAGGVGTLVAMPNTTPVVSSPKAAEKIEDEAAALQLANMFQAVSITKDFNGKDTTHLASISADKVPVVSEDGHDVLDSTVMLDAMKKATSKGCIVSCHCEDPSLALAAKPFRSAALDLMKQYSIPAWGISSKGDIPNEVEEKITQNLTKANELLAVAEDSCTERNLLLAEIAGCRIHIAHCSTKNSIDAVRRAKLRQKADGGFSVSCEITPHHLALIGTTSPEIRALVNPPLRSEKDRQALIEALRDGTADVISTDHAPHTMDDKANGSPGFSGIETSFAVCNTVLVHQNGFTNGKLSELMSAKPASLLKLNKGLLKTDYDADLVIVNPNEKWTVRGKDFFSKGKATPFEGKELLGRIKATFIAGKKVFSC